MHGLLMIKIISIVLKTLEFLYGNKSNCVSSASLYVSLSVIF